MFTKLIMQMTFIFSTLAVSGNVYGLGDANGGIPTSAVEPAGEPAMAANRAYGPEFTATSGMYSINPASSYIPVHNPRLYPRYSGQYIYRDNEKQPIRDFRYYKVSPVPIYESHKRNIPLRDFRFEYWENKEYK